MTHSVSQKLRGFKNIVLLQSQGVLLICAFYYQHAFILVSIKYISDFVNYEHILISHYFLKRIINKLSLPSAVRLL